MSWQNCLSCSHDRTIVNSVLTKCFAIPPSFPLVNRLFHRYKMRCFCQNSPTRILLRPALSSLFVFSLENLFFHKLFALLWLWELTLGFCGLTLGSRGLVRLVGQSLLRDEHSIIFSIYLAITNHISDLWRSRGKRTILPWIQRLRSASFVK